MSSGPLFLRSPSPEMPQAAEGYDDVLLAWDSYLSEFPGGPNVTRDAVEEWGRQCVEFAVSRRAKSQSEVANRRYQ